MGTCVRLTGFKPDKERVLQIGPEGRADRMNNEIPTSSPLARAIHGPSAGGKVHLCLPAGETEVTILGVGQLLSAGACRRGSGRFGRTDHL